jgi:CMP-N-acetylneuraminic acid synthetase
MDADGRLSPFFGGAQMDVPRQAHADLYIPNGAIYAARTESLLHAESFYTDETRGYLMSSDRSIDIDDSLDFTVAECLLRARFGEALV